MIRRLLHVVQEFLEFVIQRNGAVVKFVGFKVLIGIDWGAVILKAWRYMILNWIEILRRIFFGVLRMFLWFFMWLDRFFWNRCFLLFLNDWFLSFWLLFFSFWNFFDTFRHLFNLLGFNFRLHFFFVFLFLLNLHFWLLINLRRSLYGCLYFLKGCIWTDILSSFREISVTWL